MAANLGTVGLNLTQLPNPGFNIILQTRCKQRKIWRETGRVDLPTEANAPSQHQGFTQRMLKKWASFTTMRNTKVEQFSFHCYVTAVKTSRDCVVVKRRHCTMSTFCLQNTFYRHSGRTYSIDIRGSILENQMLSSERLGKHTRREARENFEKKTTFSRLLNRTGALEKNSNKPEVASSKLFSMALSKWISFSKVLMTLLAPLPAAHISADRPSMSACSSTLELCLIISRITPCQRESLDPKGLTSRSVTDIKLPVNAPVTIEQALQIPILIHENMYLRGGSTGTQQWQTAAAANHTLVGCLCCGAGQRARYASFLTTQSLSHCGNRGEQRFCYTRTSLAIISNVIRQMNRLTGSTGENDGLFEHGEPVNAN